jgi:hypothetical protein
MIVAQREMLRLAQGELTVSRLEIERYKLMLAKARREQYGQSSERARHLAHDTAMGPKTPHSTVLSGEEEAMVIAFEEFLRPAIIEVLDDALATAKFGMLSSPRRPSSTIRILSSAEKCRRVARRMFLTTCVAGSFPGPDFCLIFAPQEGYDEPEPSSTYPICLMSADGGQHGQKSRVPSDIILPTSLRD